MENYPNIYITTAFPMAMDSNPDVIRINQILKTDRVLPILSSKRVAERFVSAMLNQEMEVFSPKTLGFLYKILELVSFCNQLMFIIIENFFQIFSSDLYKFFV